MGGAEKEPLRISLQKGVLPTGPKRVRRGSCMHGVELDWVYLEANDCIQTDSSSSFLVILRMDP